METLGRLQIRPKEGSEEFHCAGRGAGFDVLGFWRWSASDLVSNATRGRLAEFIVARALGIATDAVRDEWAAYDLLTPGGIRVEVKSGAYLQTWHQSRISSIVFRVPRTRAWDPDTNLQATAARRQADVYVFAILAHQHKPSVDPLDLNQWKFHVLPTRALDARARSQDSITLRSLQALAGPPVDYGALQAAVTRAAAEGGGFDGI